MRSHDLPCGLLTGSAGRGRGVVCSGALHPEGTLMTVRLDLGTMLWERLPATADAPRAGMQEAVGES